MELSELEINIDEHDAGFPLTLNLSTGKQVIVRTRGLMFQPYRNTYAELMRKAAQTAGRDGLDLVGTEKVESEAMAEHLLLGWEGITVAGEPVPYSKEQARTFLTDRRYRLFFEAYREALVEQKNTTVADKEARIKN